jgi:hypothetical protein
MHLLWIDALRRIRRMRTKGSWIPNWAAPNPVAWHTFLSVRTVMIGQAHAATAASAIPGTFPSLLGSGLGCRGEPGAVGVS